MSKSINIIKLFTIDGPIHIDSNQLNSNRRLLTIYTAEGDKMSYVAPTEKERENASYGVHRDNLFATQELAKADSDRIWRGIYGDRYTAEVTA